MHPTFIIDSANSTRDYHTREPMSLGYVRLERPQKAGYLAAIDFTDDLPGKSVERTQDQPE
jgi:hypothetical protein